MQIHPQQPVVFPAGMTRRQFLGHSLQCAALAAFPAIATEATKQSKPTLRAAIIGHTGQGDYGHEQDQVFNGREKITIVAVADPDAAGRTRAAARTGALRMYADYREMLAKETPDLVSIAPRWTGEHHAMGMAALRAGAHLYMEKPFTQTLSEADELNAHAIQAGRRIVVAHQMRLAPNILALKKAMEQGLLGELLAIHAHGKQDHRAGGEDMVVLGTHLFDLMRFFAGDPMWASSRILQDGHEIKVEDVRQATENIGPVAGNEIMAEFAFPNGVHATFVSRAKNRQLAGPWGLELVGAKGVIRIQTEMIPRIYRLTERPWTGQGKSIEWRLWEGDTTVSWPQAERGFNRANERVVNDWLEAITQDRQAVCSGYAGMKALEMAMAVFEAGLTQSRAAIPLKNRQHPLRL